MGEAGETGAIGCATVVFLHLVPAPGGGGWSGGESRLPGGQGRAGPRGLWGRCLPTDGWSGVLCLNEATGLQRSSAACLLVGGTRLA